MAKTYSRPSKAPQAHQKFMEKKIPDVSKMPRREMLIIYYQDRGFKVVSGRTTKYVTMEKPGEKSRFIGKNGAVHIGTKISDSYAMNINYKQLPAMVEAILKRRA